MALAVFSKLGVTPDYTFPKGTSIPFPRALEPNQSTGISGGGKTLTNDYGDVIEEYEVTIKNITAAEFTLLKAFLADPLVNYRQETFTWTDESATARIVRLMNPAIDYTMGVGGLITVTLALRVEPT